ncbi:MAG: NUDIX domain-containing protein [Clostridia bacterium]|nr:NUDIX domain-containing protein [Clostridia bacterium]
MITEKSCGGVVFTRVGEEIRYVIIRGNNGVYGFPKGHMEPGEGEEQTALREIAEEAGLSVRLLPGFRSVVYHHLHRNGEQRKKRVVYYLAEYSGQTPERQESEVKSIHLMEYAEAMKALTFGNVKRVLMQANEFLSAQ